MPVEEISVYLYKITKILLISLLCLIIYYLINIGNNFVKDSKKIKINKNMILPTIFGVFFIIIVYNLFKRYAILYDTFITIIISIILAYLFNPIINYLESKGLKRLSSVLLLYLFILGGILIFIFLIAPRTSQEIKKFIYNTPTYMGKISGFVDKVLLDYNSITGEIPLFSIDLEASIKDSISSLKTIFLTGIKNFIWGISTTFSKLVSLILTPILTLYFLVDKDYFIFKFLKLIPEKHMDDSLYLFKEIDNSLSKFVRGRLFMAAYVGVSITAILLLLRVDFAIAIGFITGIADIIPYIGPFLGFLPAVFFAFLDSSTKAIWVSILFLTIQWTENNILAPKIIGDNIGLHPITVLLSIVVGGGMFGVLGMILSVPIVSIVLILYNFIKDKLSESR